MGATIWRFCQPQSWTKKYILRPYIQEADRQKLKMLMCPGGSEIKASAYNAGDLGSVPGSERSPEKEMGTHSSILAWRIPWTEEPGGLQSMGSQTVEHN